jgi:DNA polymerase III subunit delta'
MKAFDSISGNEQVKRYLIKMVKEDSLASSILFAGPDGAGKNLFAKAFATLVLGSDNHPDLHHYYPEGKLGLHSINTMRQFSHEVYMAPYQGHRKVFIIHQAERMLPYSSNALLKTFEEPPQDTVILLISSVPDALLPTILSRCRIVRFTALAVQKEKNEVQIMAVKLLSQGKLGTIKQLSEASEQMAAKVAEFKNQESFGKEHAPFLQENLSAAQIQELEKELDGMGAMQMLSAAQALFDAILGWYRDLQLLHVDGNRKLLLHPDFEPELEQSLQRGELLPLETVQKAVSQAKLSLERSTSLKLCLETLFLQLNLIN